MATTIVSGLASSFSASTGRSNQRHLVYGTNNAKWYLFYISGTQGLSLAYSSDFVTWTTSSAPLALSAVHNSEGRNYGFTYANIASNDIVHMNSTYFVGTTSVQTRHARFKMDNGVNPNTGWTTTNSEAQTTTRSSSAASNPSGAACALDSTNKVYDASSYISSGSSLSDQRFVQFPNADTTATWTPGTLTLGVSFTATNFVTSFAFADLGGGNVLSVCDNASSSGSMTQLEWSKWTGSWSAAATVLASTVTSTSSNSWGMVARTTTEIHVVALSDNSSSYVHRIFNGTSWSNGASIPTLAAAGNAGLFLATDGTTVWLFTIANTGAIGYVVYSGGAWSGSWTSLAASSGNTRSYITGYPLLSGGAIGVVWTELVGSTYSIIGTILGVTQAPVLGVANVGVGAPALTPAPFGASVFNLGVANVGVGAPLLTPAPSGSPIISLAIANAGIGAPLLSPAPTGSALFSPGVANVSTNADNMAIVLGSLAFSVDLGNAIVAAPTLATSGTGAASWNINVANSGVSALDLVPAPSGSASLIFLVANIDVAAQVLGLSGSGEVTRSFGVANIAVQATDFSVTAGGTRITWDIANASLVAPQLSPAASGTSLISLDVANVAADAQNLIPTPSGSALALISQVNVPVQAITLNASPSGEALLSIGSANILVGAPTLSVAPSGSAVPSFLVADIALAAPSLVPQSAGSAVLPWDTANIGVGAPSFVVVVPGILNWGVIDCGVDAQPLAISGSGSATPSFSVANVGVGALSLTPAASGSETFLLDTANVSTGISTFSVSGDRAALVALGSANLIAASSSFAVALLSRTIPFPVADTAISAPLFSVHGGGGTLINFGVANISTSSNFIVGAPSNIFSIQASMTSLIN